MIVNKVNNTFCYSFVLWSGFFSAYRFFFSCIFVFPQSIVAVLIVAVVTVAVMIVVAMIVEAIIVA